MGNSELLSPSNSSVIGIIIFLIATSFTSFYNSFTSKQISENHKLKNRFKKIMDISRDGIIIVNDQTIEYVNDKFI